MKIILNTKFKQTKHHVLSCEKKYNLNSRKFLLKFEIFLEKKQLLLIYANECQFLNVLKANAEFMLFK